MARLEDHHWWYRGLRAMIDLAWEREVGGQRPGLLDVGCGTGGNMIALRGRARVTGVDVAPEAVACCRARGLPSTLLAGADALPFADRSFDMLLSCDVLSHRSIVDERAVLREMARVLRPGGTLILNLPAYGWLHSSHDRAVQQDKRYTRPRVRALLNDAGFEPTWLTHWNGLLLPAAMLVRLWRKATPGSGSDLAVGSGAGFGGPLGGVLAAERVWLRHGTLAFGLSVFAVARLTGGAGAGDTGTAPATCTP